MIYNAVYKIRRVLNIGARLNSVFPVASKGVFAFYVIQSQSREDDIY